METKNTSSESFSAAFFPIEFDKIKEGESCLFTLATAFTVPVEVKGFFTKKVLFKKHGECVVNVSIHHSDSYVDEFNLGIYQSLLSEVSRVDSDESQRAYVLRGPDFLDAKQKAEQILESMSEEGWDTAEAIAHLRGRPEDDFVYIHPEAVLEYLNEIDSSNIWEAAHINFHSYIKRSYVPDKK